MCYRVWRQFPRGKGVRQQFFLLFFERFSKNGVMERWRGGVMALKIVLPDG